MTGLAGRDTGRLALNGRFTATLGLVAGLCALNGTDGRRATTLLLVAPTLRGVDGTDLKGRNDGGRLAASRFAGGRAAKAFRVVVRCALVNGLLLMLLNRA